ncbi:unnamed protein product [Candidula unifasciata]|uniref:PH domain-containing protein n=1 Tax=Candidula unifasciata TaxID=100452 RepID=A0A8S3Z807_9EUPU|nr:unnamed protein product [Candidula unifasciata]
MANEDLKKSLWHAFDLLDITGHPHKTRTLSVPKTKLKVLTNNLGHLLGLEKAETIWDHVPCENVCFDLFMDVLYSYLFTEMDKYSVSRFAYLKSEIDNLCWMLCEKSYRQISKSHSVSVCQSDESALNTIVNSKVTTDAGNEAEFSSDTYFKLWKIFNFLVERAEDGSLTVPLKIDLEEAERVLMEVCQRAGLPVSRDILSQRQITDNLNSEIFLLDFYDFLRLTSERLSSLDDQKAVSYGISQVHGYIVADIVRKGYMVKFGNKITTWKERWFVLTASTFRYYVTSEEKDLKGTIFLGTDCKIKNIPEKSGSKYHRFILNTPSKDYELSAPDLKSKNES